MSTTDLYILNQKSVTHLKEFTNGHGSGPVVWEFLGNKYIKDKPIYWMGDDVYMNKIWKMPSNPDVMIEEKIALLMSYDWAFVPMQHLEDAATACIKFWNMSYNPDYVNHWKDIGNALLEVATSRQSRYARGVIMSCTSVNDYLFFASKNEIFSKPWSIFK